MIHGHYWISGEAAVLKSIVSAISTATFVSALMIGAGAAPAAAGAPGGILSEIKVGVLDHDPARDSTGKQGEMDSIDINGEILSVPLKFASSETPVINSLYQPRVHVGFTANTGGWTNVGYAGLTWDWNLGSGFFFDFAFGFAGHDGQLKGKKNANGAYIANGRPNLGSQVLFREGLDIGYHIDGTNSVSIYAAHISNAGWFAKENDGMNFLGARYGYKFD